MGGGAEHRMRTLGGGGEEVGDWGEGSEFLLSLFVLRVSVFGFDSRVHGLGFRERDVEQV